MSTIETESINLDQITNLALKVSGVFKHYGLGNYKTVLNGVDIKCPSQKLYVLYGSRKSGKTTLLRAILRLEAIDLGSIEMFGQTRRKKMKIGFMPQSDGLYMEFTVLEMINYFAKFVGISKFEGEMKLKNIQNTLSISNLMARISTLEFEQRKNLSFAIATLDDPEMLFLDDPTSGSDPYFKYQIWKKIKKLIKLNGTTVFLTTTDSQECENADIFGYLRGGKIVLEDSPKNLMEKYFVNSMEKVFFCVTMQMGEPFRETAVKIDSEVDMSLDRGSQTSLVSGGFTVSNEDVLCHQPTKKVPEIHNKEIFDHLKKRRKHNLESVAMPSTTSSKRILYLFEKELVGFFRNTQKMISYFVIPIVCILLFFYTVGGKLTELRLGIVNLESHSCPQDNQSKLLSCELISLIDQSYIKITFFGNKKSARNTAYQGKIDGILILAKSMTEIMNSFGSQEQTHYKGRCVECQQARKDTTTPNNNDCEECQPPKNGTVHLELNYSSKLVSSSIIKQVATAYDKLMMAHVSEIEAGKNFELQPIKLVNHIFGTPSDIESVYVVWGALTILTHICGCFLGALPLFIQRESDALSRLYVFGVTTTELQLVHWITTTLLTVFQNIILILLILTLSNHFSAYKFCIILLMASIHANNGITLGVLFFVVYRRQVNLVIYILFLEVILTLICGIIWPWQGLPNFMKQIAVFLPHRHVTEAFQTIALMNLSILNQKVWLGLVSSLVWTGIFRILGLLIR